MAVLQNEGTYPIMYGGFGVPVGAGYQTSYLARPDKVGRFPTVLIVPGIAGLTSAEKDLCRGFARKGLATLAVDPYGRNDGDPLERYARLSDRRALTVLDEVAEFLASDDVDWAHPGAVGVLGIDVGGRFALALAAQRPWVRSAVVCYTPLTGDGEREIQVASLLEHIGIPLLGLYGADDELIDNTTVDEAQRRNASGQWLLYEGTGHGFLAIDEDTFHPDSANDAEGRIVAFFAATLPSPTTVDLG